MSVCSVLLRLLLSVALIFNGAATAVASAHMNHAGMAEAAAQPEPAAVQTDEIAPCHQHQQTASTSEAPATALDAELSEPESPSHDCCKSGACRCACAHHAQVAILDVSFSAPVIEHAASAHPMYPGHASPALPHLIRPPIG